MGLFKGISSVWRGAILLRRLLIEVRGTRKALDSISQSLEELLYLQVRNSPGFSNFGRRDSEPEDKSPGQFFEQSDEDFARLEALLNKRGGEDAVALDFDFDDAGQPDWFPGNDSE